MRARGDRVGLHHGQVAREVDGKPRVLPHLGHRDPLQRVDEEHPRDEVARARGEVARERVDAALDLFKQVGNVLVVKGEASAEERVEDDPARPDVDLGAGVEAPGDDLRGRVVGRAARGLQEVAVAHHVREAKVGDLHVRARVEEQVLRLLGVWVGGVGCRVGGGLDLEAKVLEI